MTERIAIFVDVQNIYYTTQKVYGCHFDYNCFWSDATRNRTVVDAVAYATHRGDEKQQQFQNILRAIGFTVKLKPFIQRGDGSTKGDWDVGITIDIMECLDQVDTVILASGDGDFDLLAQKVTSRGINFEAYGVRELTASSLIQKATRYIPVEGHLLLRKTRR